MALGRRLWVAFWGLWAGRTTRRSRGLRSRNALRGLEPLEQRSLLSATALSAAFQGPLAPADPDDQIAEARSLGAMTATRSVSGAIEAAAYGPDVDMFSFVVAPGQKIAFDVDRPDWLGIRDSYLRLFDGGGTPLLADRNGAAPRESATTDTRLSYMEYTFSAAGTYYLGISGYPNTAYNPVSGGGDVGGSTGQYSLIVTPITQTLTALTGVNEIDGRLTMPNPVQHRPDIDVSLRRVDSSGAYAGTVAGGRQTWIVIHGRNDSPASLLGLAAAIDNTKSGDQVLVLDWSEGAADNHLQGLTLDGAEWIPSVADWTAGVLGRIGLSGTSEFLVGHSWGTFVAYEIGVRVAGGVKGLVALDPAFAGVGYPDSTVNFRAVSAWSWAFYGDDAFGSARKSGTAAESFKIEYDGVLPNRWALQPPYPDALAAHWAAVRVFETLVRRNSIASDLRADLFNLGRLENPAPRPWVQNAYAQTSWIGEFLPQYSFEGVLRVKDVNANGQWGDNWNEILALRYRTPTKGEVTV